MAMLHVVDLGKVKVEVELRLGLSGGLDDVAGKVRLLADALAGRMVEGEALADADEQLAKVREELAVAKLDMDRARTELADAQEQIVSLSKQLQASRSAHSAQCCKTDDLREQILSLEKQLSSAAGMSAGSPPRGPDVLAVEDVQDSPAAVEVAGPPSSTEAVAGDAASHEEPRADGQQVAGNDGLRTREQEQDPEAPGENQDREAGAGRLAGRGSGNGGPPAVPAAAKQPESRCLAKSPDGSMRCGRLDGHSGDHTAYSPDFSYSTRVPHHWTQDPEKATAPEGAVGTIGLTRPAGVTSEGSTVAHNLNEQKETTDQAEQSAAATAHGAGTPDSGSENAADKNASGEVSNDVSEAPALPGLAPPPKKKPRNVPATCIVPGCTLPGSSRKQWCCPGHGATLSLTERQSLLAAWKRLNKQEAARAVA